jgi:hypothetical protein
MGKEVEALTMSSPRRHDVAVTRLAARRQEEVRAKRTGQNASLAIAEKKVIPDFPAFAGGALEEQRHQNRVDASNNGPNSQTV